MKYDENSIQEFSQGDIMLHPDRVHGVRAVDSEKDLAEILANHKWPLCMGFEFDDFLYLNDGDREDSPEYASLKIDDVDGLMVTAREAGRIKPLGMEASKVSGFVQDMRAGRWSTAGPLRLKAEPDWHHSCELCEFRED